MALIGVVKSKALKDGSWSASDNLGKPDSEFDNKIEIAEARIKADMERIEGLKIDKRANSKFKRERGTLEV